MSTSLPRSEISVGLFLLIGAALAAGLALRFSRPVLGPRGGYPIVVEVRDATGIRAGVPVRLGGVEIGRVAGEPELSDDAVMLSIPLEISPGRRIPVGATVKVGTSGLMGDSFIRILPPERPTGEFLPEGFRILAEPASTFTDLAGDAGEAFEGMSDASVEIRAAAQRVETLAAKLENELLTDENLENLGAILTELRSSSENLRAASDRFLPLLSEAGVAMEEVGGAAEAATASFAKVDEGVAALTGTLSATRPVLAEFDRTLDDLRKTLDSANTLIHQIEGGDGLAAALLRDSALKRDLEGFVAKLSRYGILFYPREGGVLRANPLEESPGDASGERRPFPGPRRQP